MLIDVTSPACHGAAVREMQSPIGPLGIRISNDETEGFWLSYDRLLLLFGARTQAK